MFSARTRQQKIDTLSSYSFDVLIVGGGITGAGIALDAISRGFSVALVEMQDFAGGTSSRSTKLVHGGLRYLKQLQVDVVAETGRERAIVYENGPHITTPLGMLLPFYKGGTFGPLSTSLGLQVYDFLAQVKKSERRKMLSPNDTLRKEPLLKEDTLQGGGLYVEYRTDDARLTIEVMKKAVELGAVCLNYAEVESFLYKGKKVAGANVKDRVSNQSFEIEALSVVNATGPWTDVIRKKDVVSNNKKLRMTKGVHIVIDQSVFPLQQSVYFDTPDGRMVFAIPREGKAYIGTTDTFYDQNPVKPVAEQQDITYLLDTIHYMFPDVNVTQKDVESCWAGVRPLIYEDGKDPSEISRKDEMWEAPTGLLTIAGGKLTGYRHMAKDVVDCLVERKPFKKYGECQTKHLSLSGANGLDSENFASFVEQRYKDGVELGLTEQVARQLVEKYGTNVHHVFRAIANKPDAYDMPADLYGQIMYAIEYEMAYAPSDVLVRRTGRMYFDIASVVDYKEAVMDLMADVLDYAPSEKDGYRLELDTLIFDATRFAKDGTYD